MPSGRDGIGEGTAHGISDSSGGSGDANDNQNAYENAAGNPGHTNWGNGNDRDGGGSNITIVHPWSPPPPPEDPSLFWSSKRPHLIERLKRPYGLVFVSLCVQTQPE